MSVEASFHVAWSAVREKNVSVQLIYPDPVFEHLHPVRTIL